MSKMPKQKCCINALQNSSKRNIRMLTLNKMPLRKAVPGSYVDIRKRSKAAKVSQKYKLFNVY